MRAVRALIHKPITIMVNRTLRHCYCRGSWSFCFILQRGRGIRTCNRFKLC